jgi:hypothetical protein
MRKAASGERRCGAAGHREESKNLAATDQQDFMWNLILAATDQQDFRWNLTQ